MINLTTIAVINKFLGKTLNPLKKQTNTHTHLYKLIINNKRTLVSRKKLKTLEFRQNKAKTLNNLSPACGKQTKKNYITQRGIYLLRLNERFRGC